MATLPAPVRHTFIHYPDVPPPRRSRSCPASPDDWPRCGHWTMPQRRNPTRDTRGRLMQLTPASLAGSIRAYSLLKLRCREDLHQADLLLPHAALPNLTRHDMRYFDSLSWTELVHLVSDLASRYLQAEDPAHCIAAEYLVQACRH